MSTDSSAAGRTEAERALLELVDSLAAVFDIDWEFTSEQLHVRTEPWFIAPGATFLRPGVDDESNNWANRGALLAAYRDAVRVLRSRGIPLEDYIEESMPSSDGASENGSA
jgi:hypothetical protein